MAALTNYTPGPSQLYFTVPDHIKSAIKNNILSLSHRSKSFETIVEKAVRELKQLLQLPENYTVVFTSSATEIWERSIENLVEEKSIHYVNGSFSARYAEIATQLHKQVSLIQVEEGKGFELPEGIYPEAEFVAITHNETSTGVSWPLEDFHKLRSSYPNALIMVDAVSSLPYPDFDFGLIDGVFFSVQKAFGLPPGLGVWCVNQKCLAKANDLQKKKINIGTYHNLLTLHAFAVKNQTPETPNTLGIYLLGQVAEDFNRRTIHTIRKETEYKAAILYQLLDQHPILKPFVEKKEHRSKTVIVAQCSEVTQSVNQFLQQHGIVPGDGYGKNKTQQLRFANFPAHSKEQFEWLVDTLDKFKG